MFINLAKSGKAKFLKLNGSAGTGKTFTINEFCRQIRNVLICAPTARAASLVGGSTVHKAFGMPSGVLNPNFQKYSLFAQRQVSLSCAHFFKKRQAPIKHASWLLFDEYSMIRCDHFDWADAAARQATGLNEPFGGKGVVLVGDAGQLGSVAKPEEAKQLMSFGYEPPFDVSRSRIYKQL